MLIEVSFNTKLKICDSIIICLDQGPSSSCCLQHHDSFHLFPQLHLQFRDEQQHTWQPQIAWLPARCHSPQKVNKKVPIPAFFCCPAVGISHVRRMQVQGCGNGHLFCLHAAGAWHCSITHFLETAGTGG